MFTIVISEKGGNERRELFDRGEISVGRVQGNDLMLPKGNVSKHHARLLFRDGRFIVTDLKSTNGTYVNGRKISQATIVREGDKIYVGDFVLRLESGDADSVSRKADGTPPRQSSVTLEPQSLGSSPSSPRIPLGGPPASPPNAVVSRPPDVGQNVSHYPLERDPDSESAPELRGMPMPALPGPPRLPVETRPRATTGGGLERSASPPRGPLASSPGTSTSSRQTAPAVGRMLPREAPVQAARRLALITLIDRVADAVDLGGADTLSEATGPAAERVERAVRDQAKAMRVEGEAPEGVDIEMLARDAIRELLDIGPIGPLIDEEQTSEIHVARPDYVVAVKSGQPVLVEPGFTCEQAVHRAVTRLAMRAGDPVGPGETIVDRRLSHDARMVAVGPPMAPGWMLTVRKHRRTESSLDDLVRLGAMSRAMATFLEACVLGRANVLIVGPGPRVIGPILAALVTATPTGERLAVLQGDEEIPAPHIQLVSLAKPEHATQAERLFFAASRLGAERIAIPSLDGPVALAAVESVARGAEGVVAGFSAPSLRQGLARLAVQIALGRPGTAVDAAREAVAESFDVAIEVARSGTDGRPRILRIAELAGTDAKGVAFKDVFAASEDSSGEIAFGAAGAPPRIAGELATRGVKVDTHLFRRSR